MIFKKIKPFSHFLIIIALSAIAKDLFMVVFPNYLKEIYAVTEVQRGFIEFPRELPGVITIFGVALLARYSDITIALIAQLLSACGILVLGFFKPDYAVMLLFIFIYSLGMHLAMPVNDAIAMVLAGDAAQGARMGRYKGVQMAFSVVGSLIVVIGFSSGLFSLQRRVIVVFVLAALLFVLGAVVTFALQHRLKKDIHSEKKVRFVYHKAYHNYYALTILYGLQKQIMLVYSPWVIISYFDKGPQTLATLTIIGSFIGAFFIPLLGRLYDKYGLKKLLFVDAWSFVAVYLLFGMAISAIEMDIFTRGFIPLTVIYTIFILDKMSNQMGMIRTLYLRRIAIKKADITPTLSLGLALDHSVSIIAAVAAGFVWQYVGAQYIFYALAVISLLNVLIARRVSLSSR